MQNNVHSRKQHYGLISTTVANAFLNTFVVGTTDTATGTFKGKTYDVRSYGLGTNIHSDYAVAQLTMEFLLGVMKTIGKNKIILRRPIELESHGRFNDIFCRFAIVPEGEL